MRAGEGKILRDLSKLVDQVNSFEAGITSLSDKNSRLRPLNLKLDYKRTKLSMIYCQKLLR
jgi:preprotein translocase subunit SecA